MNIQDSFKSLTKRLEAGDGTHALVHSGIQQVGATGLNAYETSPDDRSTPRRSSRDSA